MSIQVTIWEGINDVDNGSSKWLNGIAGGILVSGGLKLYHLPRQTEFGITINLSDGTQIYAGQGGLAAISSGGLRFTEDPGWRDDNAYNQWTMTNSNPNRGVVSITATRADPGPNDYDNVHFKDLAEYVKKGHIFVPLATGTSGNELKYVLDALLVALRSNSAIQPTEHTTTLMLDIDSEETP